MHLTKRRTPEISIFSFVMTHIKSLFDFSNSKLNKSLLCIDRNKNLSNQVLRFVANLI